MTRRIGTLSEKSLHAALKAHYAQPDDWVEYPVEGYIVDIVRPGDSCQCIEIQTRNLAQMKPKLLTLLDQYPVRLVYPIAQERYIVKMDPSGVILSRRKSPKKGTILHVFSELVSFPTLVTHPHFSLDVVLIHEEEIWMNDGAGSWRRRHWSIYDRRLIDIFQICSLSTPASFAALLPVDLPEVFDSSELAQAIRQPRPLAQKMVYCLRQMAVLEVVGKQGNTLRYAIAQ
jgi:hypothetical protein